MDLRAFLDQVAAHYNRSDGLKSPTQMLLKRADEELSEIARADIVVKGSGGKGEPTYTPWVGFFNPDETIDPQEGIYVVYLFAEDLQSVTLTLNQGMEHLRKAHGDAKARVILKDQATQIRNEFPNEALSELSTDIALASKGARQQNYVAGNIAAISYSTSVLPDEETLQVDLDRMLDLYDSALEVKARLLLHHPGAISSPAGSPYSNDEDPLRDFKPKDDSDYETYIKERKLRKTRRHETLLRRYGEWSISHGTSTSTTEHPKDLVLHRDDVEWLVEAKVLYLGNATQAVRAALGQLFAYRHFLYQEPNALRLLALFSEPIGLAYMSFLASLGIESVWWDAGHWVGTVEAASAGLAELAVTND